MSTTKLRPAFAVGATALGVMVPAMPAQAAAPAQSPARPPALRLQGAETTVTMIRPTGTRDVYLRATTIKRTLNGTIVRNVNRIPIRWTLTKPIILNGKVVAKVSAGATGQGASQSECNAHADLINNAQTDLLEAIEDSDRPADYASEEYDYEAAIDRALDRGCFVIF